MRTDIVTIMWKEWREVLRMSGKRRGGLLRLIISIGVLGIIWPWQLGAHFVTSSLAIVLAAFTAAMHVAGIVPDAFAGERERHTLETLLASRLPDRAILFGKIGALTVYGLAASAIMLVFGWATVNVAHARGHLLLYAPGTLVGAALFSTLAAGLLAAVGVLVSLRAATVKQAQQVLSTAVLVVLFVPVIALPGIPPSWRQFAMDTVARYGPRALAAGLAVLLLLVQLVLYAIVLVRFKRARLILD